MGIGKRSPRISKDTIDAIKHHTFFGVLSILGISILVIGIFPPYSEVLSVLSAAFIIAASVGVYMMLGTRRVATKLYERFDDINIKLGTHTDILIEIASSQKEMITLQKGMASSQKETASILTEMSATLKNIDRKIK